MRDGVLLLVVGGLLTAGLAVSMLAGRLRIPGLVLVLGLGMVIGSDGLGWISFDDYKLARTVGVVALALILFEGGVAAGWDEIRSVLGPAISLAVIGTMATALLAGLAAAWLFGLPLSGGLLLGSILASTDGAAVFAVLRGSTLRRRLARTLEGEAGLNDPIAVLLVLGCIDWATHPGYSVLDFVGLFAREIGIGAAVGGVIAAATMLALRRLRLASAGLYPVVSIAAAALAYGAADTLHGSGFLAVYLAGLAVGSTSSPARRTIATFHDGLAWVAQLSLFLVLGLLVFPSQLGSVAVKGTVLALIVVVVARPLGVVLATLFSGFTSAERIVLGWAGLRGAVPVVLATFPVIGRVPHSAEFFNIVFFAVLVSTVLQGTTFESLAHRLSVTTDEAALPSPLIEPGAIRRLGAEVHEVVVGEAHAACGRPVRELELPRAALLNLIIRGEQAIPPRGSTRIEPGDRLHVLVRQEASVEFLRLARRWRDGPLGPVRRPRPVPRATAPIFTSRPWKAADGDPAQPLTVGTIAVVEQLRTRRDQPGALVALADGRYAATGAMTAIGSASQLQEAARRASVKRWTTANGPGGARSRGRWRRRDPQRLAIGAAVLGGDEPERSGDGLRSGVAGVDVRRVAGNALVLGEVARHRDSRLGGVAATLEGCGDRPRQLGGAGPDRRLDEPDHCLVLTAADDPVEPPLAAVGGAAAGLAGVALGELGVCGRFAAGERVQGVVAQQRPHLVGVLGAERLQDQSRGLDPDSVSGSAGGTLCSP